MKAMGMTGQEHAEWCARAIREYWHLKGYEVEVKVERGPVHTDSKGASIWLIRSDMVNGCPRET